MNLSFGFSRAVGSASDTSNDKVLHQPMNRVVRQSDFRVKICFKKKTFFLPNSCTSPHVIHVLVGECSHHSLANYKAKPACVEHSCLFGIDKPRSNGCSHETLLHLGLQSSQLNICYDHQDLHPELF